MLKSWTSASIRTKPGTIIARCYAACRGGGSGVTSTRDHLWDRGTGTDSGVAEEHSRCTLFVCTLGNARGSQLMGGGNARAGSSSQLAPIDIAIVVVYLLVIVAVGVMAKPLAKWMSFRARTSGRAATASDDDGDVGDCSEGGGGGGGGGDPSGVQDTSDFFLGGRTIPWWCLAASGMSSNLDVSGTMINTAWVFSIGASGELTALTTLTTLTALTALTTAATQASLWKSAAESLYRWRSRWPSSASGSRGPE